MSALTDLALALDPALIMEIAGYTPDPWQASLLRRRSKRLILNCSRRSGKSTVVGAMALDYLRMKPESCVLIFAPTQNQSQESLAVVMKIHGKSGMRETMSPAGENMTQVRFPDGSRIIALCGVEKNVRGLPDPDLVIIDEAARVPDALYFAVLPMLAVSKGAIALLSTPFGKTGFFYDEWKTGEHWDRVSVKATECNRITPEFLKEMKAKMPHSWFRQEYFGEFTDAEGAVFRQDDIDAALSADVAPLFATSDNPIDGAVKPLFQ